jgi:hypothetical protein
MKYEDFNRLTSELAVVRNHQDPKIAALRAEAKELDGRIRRWSTTQVETAKARERVVGGLSYEEHCQRAFALGERIFSLAAQSGHIRRQPSARGNIEIAEVNLFTPADGDRLKLNLVIDATRFSTRLEPPFYTSTAAWRNYVEKTPMIEYGAKEAPTLEQYEERPVNRMLGLVAVEEAVDFAESYIAEHGIQIPVTPKHLGATTD